MFTFKSKDWNGAKKEEEWSKRERERERSKKSSTWTETEWNKFLPPFFPNHPFLSFLSCRVNFLSFLSCRVYFLSFLSCRVYFLSFLSCRVYFLSFLSCRVYFLSFLSCRVYVVHCSPSTTTIHQVEMLLTRERIKDKRESQLSSLFLLSLSSKHCTKHSPFPLPSLSLSLSVSYSLPLLDRFPTLLTLIQSTHFG